MARELNAKIRSVVGRHAANRLRRESLVPAVIYREGKPGTNLTLEEKDWVKCLASGQRVVTLKMDGGDRQALIKDVQYDHLGAQTLHVDFNELKAGQKVRLAVSVILKGIPKGTSSGGLLNHEMHTLHVECLPEQIPEKIIIDVEPMNLDAVIHVRDVKMPEGVHALDDSQLVVCSVHLPRAEKVSEDADAATEPEVLTAKKPDGPVEGGPKVDAKKEEKKK